MPVSRLRHIPGIGVDEIGDAADAAGNPELLRLENLDTDVPPPAVAREVTHAAVEEDRANSYLPFQGHRALREAAAEHVSALAGHRYDPGTQCVSVAGGLNGILNVLLATVEPGQEVVICDPIYAGLVNRIRLAGGVPRHVRCVLAQRLGDRPGRAGRGHRAADGRRAADEPGHADRRGAGRRALRRDRRPVSRHGAWVIWDAAMERSCSPAARRCTRPPTRPCCRTTITVGSASKELRMIGWRVGWVAGPRHPGRRRARRPDQRGVPGRHRPAGRGRGAAPPGAAGTWRPRPVSGRNAASTILGQLAGYPCVRPDGGWSLLVDCGPWACPPARRRSACSPGARSRRRR